MNLLGHTYRFNFNLMYFSQHIQAGCISFSVPWKVLTVVM